MLMSAARLLSINILLLLKVVGSNIGISHYVGLHTVKFVWRIFLVKIDDQYFLCLLCTFRTTRVFASFGRWTLVHVGPK